MTSTSKLPPKLAGLTAFPLTPANGDGTVRTNELQGLVDRLADTEIAAIGVLGSTGIQAYLSRAERRHAVEAAVAANAGRRPIMAGVGAMRTDDAVALAQDAAQAGADWLVLAPISYTPLTQDEAFEHYRSVAQATDLPMCVYNNPGTTHFTFARDLIAQLAGLPHVAAIKMPLAADGDCAGELASLRAMCPADFSIGYSGDWEMASAMGAGADCFHSAVAGLLPGPCLRLMADPGFTGLEPLWELCRTHGSLRVLYACAGIMGLTDAHPPRPLLPLPPETEARCRAALEGLA